MKNEKPCCPSWATREGSQDVQTGGCCVTDPLDCSNVVRYPGHIAKAERQLQDYLKMVDVVVEVRDCRIPAATTHQLVPTWVGKRQVI